MSNRIERVPRTPWDPNFPDVITFCSVPDRDKSEAYMRAKYAKNYNQAEELISGLKKTKEFKESIKKIKDVIKGVKEIHGKDAKIKLLPVHSVETGYDPRKKKSAIGSNPLPLALTLAISDETNLPIDTEIVQSNIVGHTGADTLTRFAYPAKFDGYVEEGCHYIIIDDHVSMGSTVANCRGHVESRGGKVAAISALTANRGGLCVRLTSTSKNRFMNAENYATLGCHASMCEKIFGYGVDCMTNSEVKQIFHHIEREKKTKPYYNLNNFFDAVIKERNIVESSNILTKNKQEISQSKLSGTYMPLHRQPQHLKNTGK